MNDHNSGGLDMWCMDICEPTIELSCEKFCDRDYAGILEEQNNGV